MSLRIAVVGIAVLVCFGGVTRASAQDDFAREGVYVGVAGTFATYTSAEDELDDAGVDADVDEALGLNARLGYRLHPNFAVEGEFEWLSEADIDVSPFGDIATIESFVLTLNGKLYVLTGRVQPFLLAGVGYMQGEIEDSVAGVDVSQEEESFAARVGGGLDIYITPNIAANLGLSYVIPTDDLEDVDFLSFGWGLIYRF